MKGLIKLLTIKTHSFKQTFTVNIWEEQQQAKTENVSNIIKF